MSTFFFQKFNYVFVMVFVASIFWNSLKIIIGIWVENLLQGTAEVDLVLPVGFKGKFQAFLKDYFVKCHSLTCVSKLRTWWYLPWVNRGNDAIMKLHCSIVPPGDGRMVTAFPKPGPITVGPLTGETVIWDLLPSLFHYSSLSLRVSQTWC